MELFIRFFYFVVVSQFSIVSGKGYNSLGKYMYISICLALSLLIP